MSCKKSLFVGDKITAVAHVNDKIEGEYKKVFSKIQTIDKPKIIV